MSSPRIVDGDHSVPGEVDYTINQKVNIKKRKERVSRTGKRESLSN